MKLKAIIFDVDGTLADTEELHRLAFNQAFNDFDLKWCWSEQDYHEILSISGGKERFRYCLDKDPELKSQIGDVPAFIIDLHRCKSGHYQHLLGSGSVQLRPGIERLLNEAKQQDIALAIATSSSTTNFTTLIENALDIDPNDMFKTIVTSDVISDKKPSPVVYQCALAGLGLTPDVCAAIEDTHNGNEAALNAGLSSIITTHRYTKDNDFNGATLVVNHLGEVDKPFTPEFGNTYGKQLVDIELIDMIIRHECDDNFTDNFPKYVSQSL